MTELLQKNAVGADGNAVSTSLSVATCGAANLINAADSPTEDDVVLRHTQQCTRFKNSEILSDINSHISHLSDQQKCDIVQQIIDFPTPFNDVPSFTTVLQHDIDVGDAGPIKQHTYRVNGAKRAVMNMEVEYFLKHEFAKPSCSPWSSPCLLVPKSDDFALTILR